MIYQWDAGGADPDQVVADFFGRLASDDPQPVDAFAERLFREAAENVAELDAIIARHSADRWQPSRIEPVVRHLLRLALAELRGGDTHPAIVINETLEIGKRYDGDASTRFMNGILNGFVEASDPDKAKSRPPSEQKKL
jgi:N utilization substance protein B